MCLPPDSDLKTANTFIGEDGSVKIGDMNVSKKIKGDNLKTQIGTPYYMSPEIWEQRPYNSKCDMWSLGCMIYELCSLRPPFVANDLLRLKRAIVSGRFPMISNRYSDDLSRVISAMLKTNPSNRASASALLQSPAVVSRLHLDNTDPGTARSDPGPSLLQTIHAPRHLRNLGSALPKACYPDTRPNSPGAWTVEEQYTARRRKEAVEQAQKVQMARVDEEGEGGQGGGLRRAAGREDLQEGQSIHAMAVEESPVDGHHHPEEARRDRDNKKVWFRENTREEQIRKQAGRDIQRENYPRSGPSAPQQQIEENIQKIQQYQRNVGGGGKVAYKYPLHQHEVHGGVGGGGGGEGEVVRQRKDGLLEYKKKMALENHKGIVHRTPAEERRFIRAKQQQAHIFWG